MEQLRSGGYEIVPFDGEADVYIINTCTVTGVADRKSRQMLHRAKKRNPEALVVACGCYVQADEARAMDDDAVDLIIGNDNKGHILELIENRRNAFLDINHKPDYEDLFISHYEDHTRAFLKIQDGCNQFCSYCLIPYVRGRVRSRAQESVIEEAERLVASGCREIVLTGIHLSSYGSESAGDSGCSSWGGPLLELLRKMNAIEGLARIRLGSLEPRLITMEFAEELKKLEKVCPHFHLSLQSGCTATLQRMNRHYTAEDYAERCRILRSVYEHPAICTDVITGFPGETEEEFAQTVRFLQELKLYEMHIFPYSVRKGTRAERLPGHVPEPIKKARSEVLLGMTAEYSAEYRAFYAGKDLEILGEEILEEDGKRLILGYTKEYVMVRTEARDHMPGEVFTVPADEVTMLARNES